ncbi:MAG: hypothetical protein F4Y02_00630 [Chloroflexi bacterium]|nr:hypothetical protein [Chloroflexota bacterium]
MNAFLSKNICDAAGWDGLLWHYGMHHFHLGSEMEVGGFVKRSHHLLFAIIAPRDAYFVDVRPHPSRRSIDWVRQDLLGIVYSNWPRLIDAHMLRGIRGAGLADEDIHRLRRTNLNAAIDIDGKAVTPLLGGVAGDGSSVLCTIHAGRLLQDLRRHDEILAGNDVREAVARNLQAQGLDAGPMLEFELVFLESLSSTPDLLAALTAEACVSRNLSRMGLAVIEKRTGSPIVLHEAEQSRA